jgi:hypothetical protein
MAEVAGFGDTVFIPVLALFLLSLRCFLAHIVRLVYLCIAQQLLRTQVVIIHGEFKI